MRLEVDRLTPASLPLLRFAVRRLATARVGSFQFIPMSYPLETKIYPFNRIVEIKPEEFYELCGLYPSFYR